MFTNMALKRLEKYKQKNTRVTFTDWLVVLMFFTIYTQNVVIYRQNLKGIGGSFSNHT